VCHKKSLTQQYYYVLSIYDKEYSKGRIYFKIRLHQSSLHFTKLYQHDIFRPEVLTAVDSAQRLKIPPPPTATFIRTEQSPIGDNAPGR